MPSDQEKIEFSKVLAERLSSLSDRVDKITETVGEMRDNHLHHIDLRLKEIETKYIKVLDAENEKIISLKKELGDRQAHLEEIKLNTWKKYFSSRK